MATFQLRLDDTLKQKADTLFSSLGLDTSTAIRIFLSAAIENNGIPCLCTYADKSGETGLIVNYVYDFKSTQYNQMNTWLFYVDCIQLIHKIKLTSL